jgi:toxin YoeB
MKLVFEAGAWREYLHWQQTDPKTAARLNLLIEDILCSPFRGIGKPEPLRENWSGFWSRRIDGEHRLVYRVIGKGEDQRLEIAQCRSHY